MDKGIILSVSGPSGVGKGTVLAEVKKLMPECGQSVSVTTRAPREGEQEGVAYFFRSKEEFTDLVNKGEIIEYDTYVDNFYGTPAGPLIKMSDNGQDVLLDLTIAGSMALKKKFEQAVTIFMLPPSFSMLKERLSGRGTETEEAIDKRLERAWTEVRDIEKFDYVVVNDNLEDAVGKVISIIRAEKCRYIRNKGIEKRL